MPVSTMAQPVAIVDRPDVDEAFSAPPSGMRSHSTPGATSTA